MPSVGDLEAPRLEALLIPVAGDWHALDVGCVREVLTEPLVTELPGAPDQVLGVFNLRGEIVPLFDTAALLGLGTLASSPFVVVVESRLGPAGLAATGIPEAVTLGEPTGATEMPGATAFYTIGKRVATLLDLETLLDPERVRK
jgi:purine-binding chemotaxis protein CheW